MNQLVASCSTGSRQKSKSDLNREFGFIADAGRGTDRAVASGSVQLGADVVVMLRNPGRVQQTVKVAGQVTKRNLGLVYDTVCFVRFFTTRMRNLRCQSRT